MGSFLVKSGFLLLLFGDGGEQSASLVLILLQERLRLFLRQLCILQLLHQVTLPLGKTAAHWKKGITLFRCQTGACTGSNYGTERTQLPTAFPPHDCVGLQSVRHHLIKPLRSYKISSSRTLELEERSLRDLLPVVHLVL